MKLFAFILPFIVLQVFSQGKKFKNKLDTIQIEENEYLENYTESEFFGLSELQDEIDFLNINQKLIDACLFFSINKLRKKYHRPALEHNMDLYKMASAYTQTSYLSSFQNDKKDKTKASKAVKYFAKKLEFHSSQLKTVVNTQLLMNLKGVYQFYYDKPSVTNNESDWGIVSGSSKHRFDSTKTKEFIAPLTYSEFCNQLSKQFSLRHRKDLKNKAFSEGSCSVLLDPRTIFKKKVPSVKVIFVYAGKRTALIEGEADDVFIYPED